MRPLTALPVWVFFLFTLWSGSVYSQNLNLPGTKDIAYANSDPGKIIPADTGNYIDIPDLKIETAGFKQPEDFYKPNPIGNKKAIIKSGTLFCPGAPTISSFSPSFGPIGTTVTISGSDFDLTPANNIVFFGATQAVVLTASANSLTVTVPTGATYQYITVTTSCNLTAYSTKPFIVTFPCGVLDNNSFAPKVDFASGAAPKWVSIGDLDGDGKADMVSTNQSDNSISIFRNTGTSGTVSFAPKVDFPTNLETYCVSIGDLDGDGKPDLAVTNYGGFGLDVSVFRNMSTPGNISLAPKIDFTTGNNAGTVSIGDIDGDGKPDLVVVNWSSNTVSILRNTGSPGAISFAPKIDFPTGLNPFGFAIGDMDADGKPDLAIANAFSNTLSIYKNLSTSGFISFAPKIDFPTGSLPYGLSMGDMDGDGKPDLAVSNYVSSTVSIFRNTSTAGNILLAPKVDFPTGSGPFAGVAITDLDGDGNPDLAVNNSISNTVSVFKNTSSSGTVSLGPKIDFASVLVPSGLAIGDLDGDRKPDLAVSNYNGSAISVFRNTIFSPTPSVSISVAPVGSVCSGSPVTFTASPVYGGTSPAYQWQVNGVNVPGANAATYTTSSLMTGDIVTVVMTSSDGCVNGGPVTSAPIIITVITTLPAAVSITANPAGAICPGIPVSFTASSTNGGTAPVYQWKKNGIVVGTNQTTYTDLTLNNNDVITCTMISNLTCVSGSPAISAPITITVNPIVAAAVTISANPSGAICSGTSITFTANPTNAGTTPVYQWKKNGISVGTNQTTYTDATLNNGDVITCTMTSNAPCVSGSPAISASIIITVNANLPAAVSISAIPSGAICANTPVTFTAIPTNGGTTPVYQWQKNGINVGANQTTYTDAGLNNNDVITCTMLSNATCVTGSPAISAPITITVNPNLPAAVSIAANPLGGICSGTPVTFTANPTNGGTTPIYQWLKNGSPVGTNQNTYTDATLNNNDIITCVMSSNATCVTGSPATSAPITMAVSLPVTASVSIAASAINTCPGGSVTFMATATNGGTNPIYQWLKNGSPVGTNQNTYTDASLINNDVITCTMISNANCVTGNPAISAPITMTVTTNVPAAINISANPSGAICSGNPVTFTATPINGGTNPVYQWKKNGINVGTNQNTYTDATLNNSDVITCTLVSNAACVTGSPATSAPITITVNANAPAAVTISANPSGAICPGTLITFTAAPTNGGATPVYQWKKNGINVGANQTTYADATLNNNDVITCTMISNAVCVTGSPAISAPITITVNANVPASVNISANPSGAICPGTSVTYTATVINGGTTPIYQWKKNGINVGTNQNTYSDATLNNNDVITCTMISNAACVTGSPAISAPITITVNVNLPAAVNISANPSGAICSGTPVTFTATATNGGTTPVYQWKKNGINAGANQPTYIDVTLNNNDVITCTMISNATCVTGSPAISPAITMTVNANLPAGVNISANPSGAICSGTPVIFTATATNGGTTPVYQWKKNGINVGINQTTYTDATLNNNDVITCTMISNAVCVTGSPAISAPITMTVNANVPAAVSISANPSGAICSGSSVTFTATATNGGTTPVYQWKKNGINVGTNQTSYTDAGLNNNDVISCELISNAACVTGSPAISAPITITVNANIPAAVSISANPSGAICSGTPVVFTATPTNGGATPIYQWKKNGINVGINQTTYTDAGLNNSDVIVCTMISNATCITGSPATSAPISMMVNPTVAAAVSISANPLGAICAGTSVSFTAIATNAGTTPVYQWKKNGINVGANQSTYTDATLNNNDVITCVMISNAACITGGPAISSPITMTVNANVPASVNIIASPAGAICPGSQVVFTAITTNGGTSPVYQWKKNGINVGANLTTFTDATLNNNDVITCTMISNAVCVTGSPAISAPITITVNVNLPAAVNISANPSGTICAGTPVTFTASTINGGTNPVYQWKKNGINVGINQATYTDAGLNNNDIITCTMISNAACVTGSPAISSAITMTVNANVPAAVSISVNPSGAICPGIPVTFTATATNGGTSPVYQWKKNGINVGINQATYTDAGLNNNDVITCTMISNAACVTGSPAISAPITMTVNTTLPPAVNITANPAGPICAMTPVTFTAIPTNGGNIPAYQWQVNGINLPGANSSTYTSSSLANGDIVNVILTSSLACASPAAAISNGITMIVTAPVIPAVQIVASSPTICIGGTLTFTASPINGGTSPVYQWQVNGVNAGTNSSTFTPVQPADGDLVSVMMTSNMGCIVSNQAISTVIRVVVDPNKCPRGFYMPTGFTPNKDGKNDVLKPLLFGTVVQYKFSIYNRWGQKVFESSDTQKGWDGRLGGIDTDSGIFVWMCTFQFQGQAAEMKKGTVALIR